MTAAFLLPTAETCQQHLLKHKWLLAPSRRVGNQWKDQINLAGTNTVNLHTQTLKSIVMELIAGELAARGQSPAKG